MSGWLFIIFLLLLGGLVATLGDLLGSKIGKARFSVLKLRPKKTAILITILTGSLISASSLFLMILVNRQLRVGLFRLGDLKDSGLLNIERKKITVFDPIALSKRFN